MNKNFLYHGVPVDMQGSVLYPLNSLKESNPDLYAVKSAKYIGREQVMDLIIPTLNCKWNDVLHFTAVHPRDLKQALQAAGMGDKKMKFYEIDAELLDPKLATIFLNKDKVVGRELSPEAFLPYNADSVGKYANVPELTKDYFKETFSKGGKPVPFVGIPHILYKGSVDISSSPIITL